MSMLYTLSSTLMLCCALPAVCLGQDTAENTVIPLWEKGAPGFEDRRNEPEEAKDWWVKNIHNPSLTVFLPEEGKATGAAVIVVPGGGHRQLVITAEGYEAAKYLQKLGVAAFVLKHRLAREEGSPYKIEEHALADGQRAVRLVRSRADEWGIDPERIGMLGFSAGGEVVSLVAYSNPKSGGAEDSNNDSDAVDHVSSKLDFQMLVYPGPLGVPEKLPEPAPPTFMVVSSDDISASHVVLDLAGKLRNAGAPVELHLYSRGGHGFNMGQRTKLQSVKVWPQRMQEWMADNFVLDPEGREAYVEEHQKVVQGLKWYREKQAEKSSEKSASKADDNSGEQ